MDSKELDALQAAVIEQSQKDQKEDKGYHFDRLKLFFGEGHEVHGIKINQPTIGDVLEITEPEFYSIISPFTSNSTSIRLMLWNIGQKNWGKVKDIEVYGLLTQKSLNNSMDQDALKIIFPEKNLLTYSVVKYSDHGENDLLGLFDPKTNDLITESEYMEIAEFIRTAVNIHPKIELGSSKTAREWIIQEDQMNLATKSRNDESSNLLSIVSALTNHPGFKYKLEELKKVNLYRFYDAAERLQIYEQTHALMGGAYSGFMDSSKIDKNLFNFMRSIE